jgi:translation initiation factor 2 subunit 1
VVTTSTPEKAEGIVLLEEALKLIEQTIKKHGGSFSVQMAPKVVTAMDEAYLARQLEALEIANNEVDGDDDDDNVEGMGEANGDSKKDEDDDEGDEEEDEK